MSLELIPSQEEVMGLLTETGALRQGHFLYSNGLYASAYLQFPLAMTDYRHLKTLSVALARKLRQNTELRAMIPQLSIAAPAPNGLPVAYGVVEALRANRVFWGDRDSSNDPLKLLKFLDVKPGEKVLLVDDILRTGNKLSQLKQQVEEKGGEVVGIAVMLYQPNPECVDFSPLPLYYLAKLDAIQYSDEPLSAATPIPVRV
jgi:orotate phosphoribosyltransferase